MALIPIPARTPFRVRTTRDAGASQRVLLTLVHPSGARLSLKPVFPPSLTPFPLPLSFDCMLEVVGQYATGGGGWANSSEGRHNPNNEPAVIPYNDGGDDYDYNDTIVIVERSRSLSEVTIDEFAAIDADAGNRIRVSFDQIERLSLIAKEFPGIVALIEGEPTPLDYSDLPYIKELLNDREEKLFDEDPIVGLRVIYHAKWSMDKSKELYEQSSLHNGNGDAFRHCLWNSRMASDSSVGADWAAKWGTAHEDGASGQPPIEKAMDLYNNSIGRSITGSGDRVDQARSKIRGGGCRIIDRNGQLVPSGSDGEVSRTPQPSV